MKDNKTKRGAPKKQPNEKRTKRLPVVQLFDAELSSYLESAESEGKNKSDWVRDTLNAQAKRTLKKKG
jgi:hypothetical protein